ncbi:MAG TPA: hypothetical protein VJN72_05320 [Gaiellales bacterium]|nr:hypothetical protein [Gaiellales bacterium]
MADALVDVPALEAMSQAELDDLFRASPAGDIPNGKADGTVLIAPGTALTETAAKLAHLLAWKGKVFDPERGELRNEVFLTGILAIQAKVYKGASWFDGGECIVLDYSHTSLVAHWIRDEIRLVAPDLYLGIVFWDHAKLIDFALRFPAADG